MIKVLLADDHRIVLDGIKAFLEKEADIEVVGEARNGREALKVMESRPVDVAVLDIRMPEMDGIETTRLIRRNFPNTKVLILTYSDNSEFIINLMRAGAYGYILKEKSKEALLGAIHTVQNGTRYFPPAILDKVAGNPSFTDEPEEEVNLTDRELEVLCLVAHPDAPTFKEIGERLNIAETTVLTHVRNMKGKLGKNKKEHLIRYAIEKGLCE